MLCTGNNFGNNRLKYKELLERIIGNFKSIMYLSLVVAGDHLRRDRTRQIGQHS